MSFSPTLRVASDASCTLMTSRAVAVRQDHLSTNGLEIRDMKEKHLCPIYIIIDMQLSVWVVRGLSHDGKCASGFWPLFVKSASVSHGTVCLLLILLAVLLALFLNKQFCRKEANCIIDWSFICHLLFPIFSFTSSMQRQHWLGNIDTNWTQLAHRFTHSARQFTSSIPEEHNWRAQKITCSSSNALSRWRQWRFPKLPGTLSRWKDPIAEEWSCFEVLLLAPKFFLAFAAADQSGGIQSLPNLCGYVPRFTHGQRSRPN